MAFPPSYTQIESLISQGRFAQANRTLQSERRQLESESPSVYELLTSELSIELGELEHAGRHARSVISMPASDALIRVSSASSLREDVLLFGEC